MIFEDKFFFDKQIVLSYSRHVPEGCPLINILVLDFNSLFSIAKKKIWTHTFIFHIYMFLLDIYSLHICIDLDHNLYLHKKEYSFERGFFPK